MRRLLISIMLVLSTALSAQTIDGLGSVHVGVIAAGVSGSWSENQAIGLGLGSASPCTSGTTTSCTWTFLPTIANSGIAVGITTSNNVTASTSVTWSCGGTWTAGPHVYDSTVGALSVLINVGNTGGCTSATFTVSGAPGTSIWAGIVPNVVEFIAPTGLSAVVDQTASVDDSTSCSASCALASFSGGSALTSTDAVVQFNNAQYTITSCIYGTANATNCAGTFTGGYVSDYNGDAIYLNAPAGSLTGTAQQRNSSGSASGHVTFAAVAFKGSSSFTLSPSQIWTATNNDSFYYSGAPCSSTCTGITVPSTTGSDLLIFCAQSASAAGASAYISSLSDNKSQTWTDLGSVRIGASSYGTQDCQYVLSDTAGVTTISATMNASGTYYFAIYEFNKSSGAAVLDAQGSTNNSGTSSATPASQGLTLSGTDDLCLSLILSPGASDGILGITNVPYPWDAFTNTNGQNLATAHDVGAIGYTMNVSSLPAGKWINYDAISAGSLISAVCFK